ncbi:hypothetical protein PMAYCL1PPCAC_29368 [Pristionchus mayeri]|uniref:t-SNARE coiled-coil homology domain-containing protein n=1 Tax=Pristionchus mayeri TaxID=1317129 RepID=A0AAN5IAT9_9BILA|nr:hypothetical protein PMAYCL1PPCAC_29368 [Pristionchus mayeri]
MTDPLLRPRRRNRDTTPLGEYSSNLGIPIDQEEEDKDHRSAFQRVLSANPSSLWSSAQETFSSIPSSFYAQQEEQPAFTSSPAPALIEVPLTMPCRDRTSEFHVTAKSIVSRNSFAPPPSKKETLNQSIQFNQIAKKIGRDLSQTCAKMEKLAELTKRKSVFEDRSEVENLSRIIKEDMGNLNKQIANLQIYSKGGAHSQVMDHTNSVVVGLQSKLANAGNSFKSMLDMRTENLREQKTRRDKFSSQADLIPMGSHPIPSSSSSSNVRSRLLDDDNHSSGEAVAIDMGHFNAQSQVALHDDSLAYAQSRSGAMETIESSISELGQIFSQLAHLVAEQGESIMRIDSNVEETSLNVDSAHSELVKYFHSISQNRWLMIKVFGVLIVFFIVFVLFLT